MSRKRKANEAVNTGNDVWRPRIPQLLPYPLPPAASEVPDESICRQCGQKRRRIDQEDVSASTSKPLIKERISKLKKTEHVLNVLAGYEKYGLGDFLESLFSPETFDQLSDTSRKSLTSWIKGNTRNGTRPAEIFDAVHRHPAGIHRDNSLLRRSTFPDLSVPSHPPSFAQAHPQKASLLPDSNIQLGPERVNSREGLEELMVRGTLLQVQREAEALESNEGLARGADLTWELLSDTSNFDQREKIMLVAPVIWTILTTIVIGHRAKPDSRLEQTRNNPSETQHATVHNQKDTSRESQETNGSLRDPTLVSTQQNRENLSKPS